jgi:hypothetical protein
MADRGEGHSGGYGEHEQNHGGRAPNQPGKLPRHISYHDIISVRE